MTVEETGSPNRREEGSNAGCLTLQSGEEVTRLKGKGLPESEIAEKFEGSRTPSAVKNRIWRLRKEGVL